MASLTIQTIRSKVKELIEASSFFSSETVIVDDGKSESAIQGALNTRGVAITVWPILQGSTSDQNAGVAKLEFFVEVHLYINAHKNKETGAANIDDDEAISKVFKAVLAYVPSPGEQRFQLPRDCFALNEHDKGLIEYVFGFTKEIVI